jgi:hypothetical protein
MQDKCGIHKGCKGYLIQFTGSIEVSCLEVGSLFLIKELLDIFLEELPRLFCLGIYCIGEKNPLI